jgi:hypothetical protein
LNYQSTFTLSPNAAATGTWSGKAVLLPHPINFMWHEKTDSVGTTFDNFMNSQLDGATHTLKMTTFRNLAQRWRMTYMSVTVYQDGPDLANQGTMVACQTPVQPSRLSVCFLNAAGTNVTIGAPVEGYLATERPDFTNMQSLPNAYFSRSKEGCYLPLKLTKTCQQWRSMENACFCSTSDFNSAHESTGTYNLGTGATLGVYPHANLTSAWVNPGVGQGGETTSAMCNDVWGMIAFKNVAVTTSFSFFVRCGFEIQCQPGTPFSTHLKLSPPHDSQALDAYFRISRELKDAYPADFNDLGKIWDVISSAAKSITPFLSGIHPGLGLAVGGATSVGDAIRAAFKRVEPTSSSGRRGMETASLGDRELAKQVIQEARTAPVPRVPKRKAQKKKPTQKRK